MNSDTQERTSAISKTIATSVSITNANIFLIADKKSMFLIIIIKKKQYIYTLTPIPTSYRHINELIKNNLFM